MQQILSLNSVFRQGKKKKLWPGVKDNPKNFTKKNFSDRNTIAQGLRRLHFRTL